MTEVERLKREVIRLRERLRIRHLRFFNSGLGDDEFKTINTNFVWGLSTKSLAYDVDRLIKKWRLERSEGGWWIHLHIDAFVKDMVARREARKQS
jgi:hypothetical protein